MMRFLGGIMELKKEERLCGVFRTEADTFLEERSDSSLTWFLIHPTTGIEI